MAIMKGTSSGCLVCGDELIYGDYTEMHCHYCGKAVETNVSCEKAHFVCDECHSADALDLIERYCLNTHLAEPYTIAEELMSMPQLKMHGPEHHFLVPAVLLAAYNNAAYKNIELRKKLAVARKRAEGIPGGYCGTHGNCGAGVGAGVFVAVLTESTPLSDKEWQMSNLMTGRTLIKIAEHGGPRCCKRDTFLALAEAVEFVKEQFDVQIPANRENFQCEFSPYNKQCLHSDCEFFKPKLSDLNAEASGPI